MEPVKISQTDNFNVNFGLVFRASSCFYFRQNSTFKTTISFLNYWQIKRRIKVGLLVSLRDRDGVLRQRQEIKFAGGQVINYRPELTGDFEGSIEIETFGNENLAFPYSAFMALYETPKSVSMIHSYARSYSRHEIEEGRTISQGEESGWTLRDSAQVRSFAVIHNGGAVQAAQQAILRVQNASGEMREVTVDIPALAPYAIHKIQPAESIQDLSVFLGGSLGHGNLSFRVAESFSRMLVGNETLDGSDFQVTHSNFNYSKHQTDMVDAPQARGYMNVFNLEGASREVIVYPDSDPGQYQVELNGKTTEFKTGDLLCLPLIGSRPEKLAFSKSGQLPSRLVTAIVYSRSSARLPAECSVGVIHDEYRKRRMWWGLAGSGPEHGGRLFVMPFEEALGPIQDEHTVDLHLYSAKSEQSLHVQFRGAAQIAALANGRRFSELFPEADAFLGGDFGYYVFYSNYGGFMCFSTLENRQGSLTVEHSF